MPQARSLITAISYIKMASWPLRMLMCGLWTVPLSKDEQHNHKQWIPARSQPKQKQPQLQAFHIYAEQPTCKANMWTVPLSEEQHNHSSPQLKFIQWIRACNATQFYCWQKLKEVRLKYSFCSRSKFHLVGPSSQFHQLDPVWNNYEIICV